MTNLLRNASIAALAAVFFTVGCTDLGPTAPSDPLPLSQVEAKKGGGGPDTSQESGLLQWKSPLRKDLTGSADCVAGETCWVFVSGLPGYGAFVMIPPTALRKKTRITMTAVKGSDVNFVFGPHGTEFEDHVIVAVDQAATKGSGSKYEARYWTGDVNNVVETLPAVVFGGFIQFATDHFSGYALAM